MVRGFRGCVEIKLSNDTFSILLQNALHTFLQSLATKILSFHHFVRKMKIIANKK